MKIERKYGILFESSRDGLMNQLYQIQRLQDEGLPLQSLADQTFDKIKTLIENQDERKLGALRDELKTL